jgi:hypothetical protein
MSVLKTLEEAKYLAIAIRKAAQTTAMVDLCDFVLGLKQVEPYSAEELAIPKTTVRKTETGETTPWERLGISRDVVSTSAKSGLSARVASRGVSLKASASSIASGCPGIACRRIRYRTVRARPSSVECLALPYK